MKKYDFSNKDIIALEPELKELITTLTKGQWNDFSSTDLGYSFLKVLLGIIDMQNITRDYQVNEMYLGSANERHSVQNLLSLIGYKMRFASAGYIDLIVSSVEGLLIEEYGTLVDSFSNRFNFVNFNREQLQPLEIPANTVISGAELPAATLVGTKYTQLLQELVKPLSLVGTVTFQIEAESRDLTFKSLNSLNGIGDIYSEEDLDSIKLGEINYKTGLITWDYEPMSVVVVSYECFSRITLRNGKGIVVEFLVERLVKNSVIDNYSLLLGSFNYARNTMRVVVDNSIEFSECEDINFETDVSKKFSVHITSNDIIEVRFGAKPGLDSSIIKVSFVETSTPQRGLIGSDLVPVSGVYGYQSSTVINIEKEVVNYEPYETVEEAVVNGPKVARTMGVAVTLSDFEFLSKNVDKVKHVIAFDKSSYYKAVANVAETEIERIETDVTNTFITNPYEVVLIACESSGEAISESSEIELLEYLNSRRFLGIQVFINKYNSKPINIYKLLVDFDYGFFITSVELQESIREKIEFYIAEYFEYNKFGLGTKLDINDLIGFLYRNILELRGLQIIPSIRLATVIDGVESLVSPPIVETFQELMEDMPANYLIAKGEITYSAS